MAAAVAKGLSKAGKDCTLKHFMANNQELSRTNVESVISERAIREIYAKPFEIAVKAGNVRAVMTAYNLINGFHAASCYDLTTTLLRKEWGFTGIVMTDWGAKMNDEGALGNEKNLSAMAAAQNDVYMVVPESPRYDDDLLDALQKGKLTKSVLQRNAANLCRFLMDTAAFERFLKNGAAYIHSAEKKKKLAEFDMPSNMTEYDVTVSGMKVYTIEITAASYAPGTAQLPIWVYANGYKVNGVSLAGSGGEYSVYTTTAALRSGKNPIMLEFPKDIEVRSMTVFE